MFLLIVILMDQVVHSARTTHEQHDGRGLRAVSCSQLKGKRKQAITECYSQALILAVLLRRTQHMKHLPTATADCLRANVAAKRMGVLRIHSLQKERSLSCLLGGPQQHDHVGPLNVIRNSASLYSQL